ncbi:hypothetical protein [Streptomyces sp. NPDC020681]|uniref:hypothetical protein n=1 Tax=Streptomyces sp. NPDC020681 TaxID=3365083 RepID=UPI0037B159F4
MTVKDLPTHLAPWAAELEVLDLGCATALGPFVRGLDALLGGDDRDGRGLGDFDGYDGLSRAGAPDRLLMSQWLLAEEAPEEFLRRAAQRELLHLAPARRAPQRRGRIAVLADTGPSQLGAARLVQLAALVVAHRRAAARGTGLLLGLLGTPPGQWRDGELPELLQFWLSGRGAEEPDPVDIDAWTGTLDAPDEAWVLASEQLAARTRTRHRVLVTRESGWSDEGAAEVAVTAAGRTARLALPDPEAAVRILRGRGWRRSGPSAPVTVTGRGVRHIAFPGVARRLVMRSESPAELLSVRVPSAPGRENAPPKRHQFPGPVLAVGYHHRRLIGLCLIGDMLYAHVIGKPWQVAAEYRMPAASIGIERAADVEGLAGEPIAPLVADEAGMLCRLRGQWYRLPWHDLPVDALEIVSALPGGPLLERRPGGLTLPHLPDGERDFTDEHAVLGPGSAHARSRAGHVWRFAGPTGPATCVQRTDKGEEPLGVVVLEGQAHLVTRSAAGQLLRVRGPVRNTVLTKWSGTPHPPALHPGLPLLAVVRDNGTVDVADLESGDRLLTLRSEL